MRILFVHRAFPAQFRYMAPLLARDPRNEVIFLTAVPEGQIPGVKKAVYRLTREAHPSTHTYLRGMENAILHGQAALRAANELKKRGFIPDLIVGHSGWGPTLFLADVFPQTPILCHFEWFYHSQGSSFGFDPKFPVSADNEAEIRVKNTPVLLDLTSCHAGITPTRWQHSRFPVEFRDKITVLHEGIDTEFFRPGATKDLCLQPLGLNLASLPEIVTYVATGMGPLRGFPQFMEAISLLQRRRPQLHAVIVGEDRTEYENTLPDGKTYKQAMLEQFPFDLSRLHFTGRLSVEEYRRVLLASSAHIYLTYPFILSWSMLEAMSCGCLVVGSDTAPVREMIRDQVNGRLVDFFSPAALAETVENALSDKAKSDQLRQEARQTIVAGYDARQLVPQQLALFQATAAQMGG
jgi:glycosyltransferase involved in cell wall biosynthesis